MYELAALSRDCFFAACSFTEDEFHDDTELVIYRDGGWSRISGAGSLRSLAWVNESRGPTVAALVEPYRSVVTPELARREAIAPTPRDALGRQLGGALRAVRQIGSHQYVCGVAGQLYKRISEDHWVLLDKTLLTTLNPYSDKNFLVMNGLNENEIYLAHDEGCSFWDGRTLRKIEGSGEKITDIFIENPSSIWLCGWRGLIMNGNHIDGFRAIVRDPKQQMFLSLCKFEDTVYLGSTRGFERLQRGHLTPAGPPTGAQHRFCINRVKMVDDVMWAVGGTDVLRWDGTSWLQVPFDPPWANAPP